MAVWTEVNGYCLIRKDSKFSFKTYIYDNFGEEMIGYSQGEAKSGLEITFKFDFPDNGISAAKRLEKFVKDVKESDKSAFVNIVAGIRFLG